MRMSRTCGLVQESVPSYPPVSAEGGGNHHASTERRASRLGATGAGKGSQGSKTLVAERLRYCPAPLDPRTGAAAKGAGSQTDRPERCRPEESAIKANATVHVRRATSAASRADITVCPLMRYVSKQDSPLYGSGSSGLGLVKKQLGDCPEWHCRAVTLSFVTICGFAVLL